MGFQVNLLNRPDYRTGTPTYNYLCAYCDHNVDGIIVASYPMMTDLGMAADQFWMLCTNCNQPSVATVRGKVYPAAAFGPALVGLPPLVASAYSEARNAFRVEAYTACELMCRKILMNIAADKGGGEGKSFAEYVQWLEDHHYITPPMKGWVELIRKHGNQSTHEIEAPDKSRAEATLLFTAQLLRIVYEMEHLASPYLKTS